jgi:hypothetical protein
MLKSKIINTIDILAIEIYKLVIKGDLKQFPRYFWEKPDSLKEASKITRYLIEKILNWIDDDIKKNLSLAIFKKMHCMEC